MRLKSFGIYREKGPIITILTVMENSENGPVPLQNNSFFVVISGYFWLESEYSVLTLVLSICL